MTRAVSEIIPLSRAQRRQMHKLAKRIGRIAGDREYFKTFPDRQHRVRIASQAEIQQLEILDSKPLIIPADCKLLAITRSVAPEVRERAYILAPESIRIDVDEVASRTLFEAAASPRIWEIEADVHHMTEEPS
jgi:hypothetical protein